MPGRPKWITEFPEGLMIRLVRYWDPVTSEWRQKMGRLCECGQIYGGIQIDPLPVKHEEPDYDGYDW